MKGKLFGEVITIEPSHGVAVANARYELKGGDSVVLRVAPWYVMNTRAPHGSVGCDTPNVSGWRTPPHAVRRPNAAGPLDPARAV